MDKDFYRQIYDEVYAEDPEYGGGHGMHLRGVVAEVLAKIPNPVHVDCGGGRHQFCAAIHELVPNVRTYSLDIHRHEPIPAGVTFVHDAVWDLSQVPELVDVITAFDVLEHLKEEDIQRTVQEWGARMKTKGMLFMTIPTGRASHKTPDGVDNLHMTVRPTEWWKEQFSTLFSFPNHPQQKPPQIVAVRT